jgi:hypothetical protein
MSQPCTVYGSPGAGNWGNGAGQFILTLPAVLLASGSMNFTVQGLPDGTYYGLSFDIDYSLAGTPQISIDGGGPVGGRWLSGTGGMQTGGTAHMVYSFDRGYSAGELNGAGFSLTFTRTGETAGNIAPATVSIFHFAAQMPGSSASTDSGDAGQAPPDRLELNIYLPGGTTQVTAGQPVTLRAEAISPGGTYYPGTTFQFWLMTAGAGTFPNGGTSTFASSGQGSSADVVFTVGPLYFGEIQIAVSADSAVQGVVKVYTLRSVDPNPPPPPAATYQFPPLSTCIT